MNTNQNGNSGQGYRDSQNSNRDAQNDQSREQYAGNESRRFSDNQDLEKEDQRLSGINNPDESRYDSSDSNDRYNEDRQMGGRDFNSGSSRQSDEMDDEDMRMSGDSDEERRRSDSRNYGGSDDFDANDARYHSAPDDDNEALEATDLDNDADDFDDGRTLNRDRDI